MSKFFSSFKKDTTISENEISYEFHEKILSSSILYGLALLCIIWGSVRSLRYIKKCTTKREKIEASISTRKALKFPVIASIVLFSLYVLIKCDSECRDKVYDKGEQYLPEVILDKINEGNKQYQKLIGFFKQSDEINDNNLIEPKTANDKIRYFFNNTLRPMFNRENFFCALLVLLCYEGVFALANIFNPFLSPIYKIITLNFFKKINYRIKFDSGTKAMTDKEAEEAPEENWKKTSEIFYDNHYLLSLLIFTYISLHHVLQRHWITNNLIGVSFSIIGIEVLHLSSYKAGCILLMGLFFYDIFWVFGTDVMTTVAKSIDAPILLQFPQDILRNGWMAKNYSMIGLGDIVIPGIFIALLYRFDNREYLLGNNQPKRYFYFIVTIISYAIGLFMTIGIMHIFKKAQPALLYLVPCCIIIPYTIASIRGEGKELWNYNEERFIDPEKEDTYFEKKKV
uniref:Minor histocompatibility antigen H13 n=1 Tax=Parastrongyloides trichosuri TaxID=131310 RepID=A0A0N4ZZW6_PARTI